VNRTKNLRKNLIRKVKIDKNRKLVMNSLNK